MDLYAIYLEFVESAVHTLLHARGIYPKHLFEQRSKYGLTLWQCRHAELDAYVRKVLSNSYQLLLAGVVGSYVVTVYDKDNNISEQIAISGEIRGLSMAMGPRGGASDEQSSLLLSSLEVLEAEFQSAILRLKMVNDHISKALPAEHRWALLVTTTAPITNEEVSSELRSGNWYADSGQLIENQGRASRVVPLKAIHNELISLSINATYC